MNFKLKRGRRKIILFRHINRKIYVDFRKIKLERKSISLNWRRCGLSHGLYLQKVNSPVGKIGLHGWKSIKTTQASAWLNTGDLSLSLSAKSLEICKGEAVPLYFFYFFNVIYLFLERGEEKEKERERNINVWLPLTHSLLRTCPTTQACALTRICTCDPFVLRPALNPLSHTSQGNLCTVYTPQL